VIERGGDLLGIRYVGRDDDRGGSGGATLFCRRLQVIAGQCHERNGRALIAAGLDELRVSLDAATEKSYIAVRGSENITEMSDVPADKIQNETFNVGYQNLSIMEIAELVRRVVAEEIPDRKTVDIVTTPTDDIRSYHINSDKIKRVLGYKPQHTIEDAVRELCQAFLARKLPNSMEDDRYYNVRLLKRLKAA